METTPSPAIPTPAVGRARHDLVALAVDIDFARSLDQAEEAYFLARRVYYAVADDPTAAEARAAWTTVLAAFKIALDRFATPITPLVVFG